MRPALSTIQIAFSLSTSIFLQSDIEKLQAQISDMKEAMMR